MDQMRALPGLAAELASGSVRELDVALLLRRFGVGPDRGSTSVSCGRSGISAESSPSPPPPLAAGASAKRQTFAQTSPSSSSTAARLARRLAKAASAST